MSTDILRQADAKQNTLFGKAFKEMPNWQITAEWMRPAPFADLQKIYGKIMPADYRNAVVDGKYLNISLETTGTHNYSVSRRVVLTQTSVAGNKGET